MNKTDEELAFEYMDQFFDFGEYTYRDVTSSFIEGLKLGREQVLNRTCEECLWYNICLQNYAIVKSKNLICTAWEEKVP